MQQEPTEDSVIKEHMFGQCQYASRDLNKHKCPGMLQRWYHGKSKSGRKTVESIIYIDEYSKCTCLCHIPEAERPKPKTRRRRTKK